MHCDAFVTLRALAMLMVVVKAAAIENTVATKTHMRMRPARPFALDFHSE
jgi:hypothetical protein